MTEETWREKLETILWDHFYILDTETCGVKQARAEKRVKPAGEGFKEHIRALCEQAEREGSGTEGCK